MSQELRERVTEVLHDADASSTSLVATGDSTGDDESGRTDLLETAERANGLLETADPDELLAAVGLDTLPDGSEPDSIPTAIARGDPEQVADLQRLLHLANLADGDDGDALEDAVEELRTSIGDGEETTAAEGNGEESGGNADEAKSDDGGAREALESVAEGVSEASGLDGVLGSDDDAAEGEDSETPADARDDGADEAEADAADGATEGLGDQLRSAMESTLTGVGGDLEGLQQRLEEASASSVGSDAVEDGADDADAAEREAEDDGLLDTELGSNQDRGSTAGSGTRYSTMAPPPSDRADMKGTARHSTMPDKHRS